MLEERINSLINSIDQLTAIIHRLWESKETIQGIQPPEKPAFEKEAEAQKSETPKGGLTTAELESFCLSLVRQTPTAKNKIKSTIKKFGGDLIKDVPEDKLPELKEALEALAA